MRGSIWGRKIGRRPKCMGPTRMIELNEGTKVKVVSWINGGKYRWMRCLLFHPSHFHSVACD